MTSRNEETCKRCKEPIEGTVIMLHGRFPMHRECYTETIKS